MRANIKDLKLGEIYDDYLQLKAIEEKYYYCGNSAVFNKATEGLMAVLKNEIIRRKLENLKANYNLGPMHKETAKHNVDAEKETIL